MTKIRPRPKISLLQSKFRPEITEVWRDGRRLGIFCFSQFPSEKKLRTTHGINGEIIHYAPRAKLDPALHEILDELKTRHPNLRDNGLRVLERAGGMRFVVRNGKIIGQHVYTQLPDETLEFVRTPAGMRHFYRYAKKQ